MGDLTDLTGQLPPTQVISLDDAPYSVTYVFVAQDFGAGDWTEIIDTPADFRGVIRNVTFYEISEVFNSVTTEAQFNIGTAGDADLYAATGNLGDLGATTSYIPPLTIGTRVIEAGTEVQVQGIAPTGGTPTGIASVAVTIQYFK